MELGALGPLGQHVTMTASTTDNDLVVTPNPPMVGYTAEAMTLTPKTVPMACVEVGLQFHKYFSKHK